MTWHHPNIAEAAAPSLPDLYATWRAATVLRDDTQRLDRIAHANGRDCPCHGDRAAGHDQRANDIRDDMLAQLTALSGLTVEQMQEVMG